ncbi:unnamed protein product [Prorocentrum cordatum]|uniref:Uncharacterized protein n=1 Tax=Prorocentrum cordatum TaxID=2364126 RepID=A0ABN9UUS7_9DINO|nr:unnamed protein product [Polarella glacialis]
MTHDQTRPGPSEPWMYTGKRTSRTPAATSGPCRIKCCDKTREAPKAFKLQFTASAEVQTAQAQWNGEMVGTIHKAFCHGILAHGGQHEPGGPPAGGPEPGAERLLAKLGMQKGPKVTRTW